MAYLGQRFPHLETHGTMITDGLQNTEATCRIVSMILRIFFATLCGLFACSVSTAADKTTVKRPNVLYVIADMERAFSMGCYGDENAKTPALDKFASQGLRM